MTKKLIFPVLVLSLILGFSAVTLTAQAQALPDGCTSSSGFSATTGDACNGTATPAQSGLPAGCTTNFGYSATTGSPCSGTGTVTPLPDGCTTVIGFSSTNGASCNGMSTAYQWLPGCTSTGGFSSINGAACNGTAFATPPIGSTGTVSGVTTTAPGLPTTGAGGNAPINVLLITVSAAIAIAGSIYLVRNYQRS